MPVHSLPVPDLRARPGTQVDFLHQVSHHAFDTVQRLNGLNLHTTCPDVEDMGAAHNPT